MRATGQTAATSAIAMACALAALAGCASHELGPWSADPRVLALRAVPTADAGERVLVEPLALDADRAAANAAHAASGAERYAPPPALGALQRELVAALRAEGRLGEVAEARERGPEALREALDAGAATLVRLRLRRYEASFAGTNGRYVWNWFNWFMFWPASWLVADERFAIEGALEVEAVDVRSERTIRKTLLEARVERDLDDIDRGLVWLGLPYTPGSLEPDNYARAAQVLAPFLARELAVALALEARGPLRLALTGAQAVDPAAPRPPAVFGVSAGISRYRSYAVHNLKYASKDAEAWHALASGPGGPIPAKNHTLLLEEKATRTAILDAVREAAARARPWDALVFFHAGYLASVDGPGGARLYLASYDTEPRLLGRTAVAVDEVEAILAASGAAQAAIVIDAGLSGTPDGRGLAGGADAAVAAGGTATGLAPHEEEGGRARTPVTILLACGPGEKALEVDEVRHGLFTHHLLSALRGDGDRDRDGRTTLGEAFALAAERVAAQAALEGVTARPRASRPGEPLSFFAMEARR